MVTAAPSELILWYVMDIIYSLVNKRMQLLVRLWVINARIEEDFPLQQ